jgi:hypothetical protein
MTVKQRAARFVLLNHSGGKVFYAFALPFGLVFNIKRITVLSHSGFYFLLQVYQYIINGVTVTSWNEIFAIQRI